MPLAEPKQSEVIQKVAQAWEQAQRQLAELRAQVEHASALAMAKTKASFLEQDMDKAQRDFGRAVWEQVRRGKLALPPALSAAVKAMQEAQRRLDAHGSEISDLLQEGVEVAARLRGGAGKEDAGKLLAQRGKKR